MADIFGYTRDPKPQSVFSSDAAHLTIEGKGDGYMIQQWQIAYQQNVQEIFELGSSNLYWVRGQPQGQMSIGRVVGGAYGSDLRFFGSDAFDVCQGGSEVQLEMAPGTCDAASSGFGTSATVHLKGVIVTAFGFSSSVQDMMIQQNIQLRFASMSLN